VIGVALAVATLASYVPALRAARTSTVDALADAARPPRRPRRVLLGSLSIAVTVSGIVAVLFAHATLAISQSAGTTNPGLADVGFISQTARETQVLLTITVMLIVLAAVNVTFITWATVQDSRHAAALTRALGATAGQLTAGLSAAQLLPATAGALAGIAGGYALFTAANQGANASQPLAWWLITAVLGTLIAVAGLTAVPARLAARLPIAETLQADGP
jgi:ABC-type antimicrobial peptide transport system permease subunit